MGRKLGFSNGAAAQVYDNLSRGAKLTGGNDGKIRVGCKEVLDVGDAARRYVVVVMICVMRR